MRMLGLAAGLIAAVGALLLATPQGRSFAQSSLDRRPVRKVLIIGNSRTYYHDMPATVQALADSAGAPVKLAITTLAWGGASFEQNWDSPEVQAALRRRWDTVVLQPESRAQSDDASNESFATYGEKLIRTAEAAGSPVALIVNWGYGESLYTDDPAGTRQAYIEAIETAEQGLAARTGARLIDTSRVWEDVHGASPSLALYEDGNHPTATGSYLSALMIEGFLFGSDVSKATYAPPGVQGADAAELRQVVDRYYAATPYAS